MLSSKTFQMRYMLLAFVFLASCSVPPTEPIATTSALVTPTSAHVLPTATPVVTEFIASKVEDIAGMWSFGYLGTPYRIRFLSNGMIKSGPEDDPDKYLHGKFTFKGTIFYVEDPTCGPGTYEAHVIQRNGQNYKLYFTVLEDACRDRVNEMKKGYNWVNP